MSDDPAGQPVRGRSAMVSGMRPQRVPGEFVHALLDDDAPAPLRRAALALAVMTFREDEGLTVVLPAAAAREHALTAGPVQAWLRLQVHSALDGVGLTAAVSTALADAGIACNVVAAFHHDHLFVPVADADRALAVLRDTAAREAART